MAINKEETIINIVEPTREQVVMMFLTVFLAKEKLTNKQLAITTELVVRYSEYINDGVKEPYASTLLFSTKIRKEIYTKLNISAAHFSNTLTDLAKKNIVALEENDSYFLNPEMVPTKRLIFNFEVNAGKGQTNS